MSPQLVIILAERQIPPQGASSLVRLADGGLPSASVCSLPLITGKSSKPSYFSLDSHLCVAKIKCL